MWLWPDGRTDGRGRRTVAHGQDPRGAAHARPRPRTGGQRLTGPAKPTEPGAGMPTVSPSEVQTK